MTLVIWAALVAAGIAIGVGGTLQWHRHRIETLGYLENEAKAFRARTVCGDLDHEHRLRLRVETELDELRADVRVWVGDLLDKVAARDQTIAARDRTIAKLSRPRHLHSSPFPIYGPGEAS